MSQLPPPDPTQRTILHLHSAAHTLLTRCPAVASHLTRDMLSCAYDNDVNLPKSFIDTRCCQRCGTAYLPGITSSVRTRQSRRQTRKAKGLVWVVYRCNVCNSNFKTEVENPLQPARKQAEFKSVASAVTTPQAAKSRKKRERLKGLKKEIEKSRAERTRPQLDLFDLMKVD
jgi:RNase P subunit RPR2